MSYHDDLATVIAKPEYASLNYSETEQALNERTADTIVQTPIPADILWDDITGDGGILTDAEVNTLISLKIVAGVIDPATASGDVAQSAPGRRITSWLATHGLLNGLTVGQTTEAMIRAEDRVILGDLIGLLTLQAHISQASAQGLNTLMQETVMEETVTPGAPVWETEGLERSPSARDIQIARQY